MIRSLDVYVPDVVLLAHDDLGRQHRSQHGVVLVPNAAENYTVLQSLTAKPTPEISACHQIGH